MSYSSNWCHPYAIQGKYRKRVTYFNMEFAIHQELKIYPGGPDNMYHEER
jgi:starch phosphorylase